MRFDNRDMHQEKKLYGSPSSLFDLDERIGNNLVNLNLTTTQSAFFLVTAICRVVSSFSLAQESFAGGAQMFEHIKCIQ